MPAHKVLSPTCYHRSFRRFVLVGCSMLSGELSLKHGKVAAKTASPHFWGTWRRLQTRAGMQVQEGERDPSKPPRPPGHTIIPPLPRVETAPDGTRDIPEDILPWQGSIFSVFSNAVADWTGSGYGALLETPSVRRQIFPFCIALHTSTTLCFCMQDISAFSTGVSRCTGCSGANAVHRWLPSRHLGLVLFNYHSLVPPT